MLKRSITAIRQWLSPEKSPEQNVRKPRSTQSDGTRAGRRGFFKKAAIGAVSVTTTAGLAKVAVDSIPQPDLREHYKKDALAGERELMEREYVIMSDQEKADMVQTFVDDYSTQA